METNWDLLQRVVDQIKLHPGQFDMQEWGVLIDRQYLAAEDFCLGILSPTECGTPACLAGWVLSLSGKNTVKLSTGTVATCARHQGFLIEASEALGVSRSLGRLLFKTLIGSASNYGVYVAGRLDYTIDRPDGCESDNEWIMDYVETCLAVRRWVDMRELYGRAE